ncbi:calcium-dependent protein kinase 11 [Lactuca sativa]|uniref:calcium-dependent protein kinase 11 n=1 Tax=Lactuca sativa TaxID=4236 RepID=UPI001C691582|nr:calcium-dependent protein kinase 11 [Lactuca sativa]
MKAEDFWPGGSVMADPLKGGNDNDPLSFLNLSPTVNREMEVGIYQQVLNGELDLESDPWPSISESAKDLLRGMLVRNTKKWMTANHPWIQADGVAPDKPLDTVVLSRLKQFSAMNRIKKIAIKVIAESLSEEEIVRLKEMFKMMDTDGSGQITLEELKEGLVKACANFKDLDMNKLMEAADIDNDGTIDYGEFLIFNF